MCCIGLALSCYTSGFLIFVIVSLIACKCSVTPFKQRCEFNAFLARDSDPESRKGSDLKIKGSFIAIENERALTWFHLGFHVRQLYSFLCLPKFFSCVFHMWELQHWIGWVGTPFKPYLLIFLVRGTQSILSQVYQIFCTCKRSTSFATLGIRCVK